MNNAQNQLYANHNIPPFLQSLARSYFPRNMEQVMAWSAELWLHNGLYASAIQTCSRYFITQVRVIGSGIEGKEGVSGKRTAAERRTYEEVLNQDYEMLSDIGAIGDDFINWGNNFLTVYEPFKRMLICPSCASSRALTEMRGKYTFTGKGFEGNCQKCNKKVVFKVDDIRARSKKKRVVRWAPQHMVIEHSPISGTVEVFTDFQKHVDLVEGIRRKIPVIMEETPLDMLQAIAGRKLYRFSPDRMFHMAAPVPSFMQPYIRGWGLPMFMAEFELAFEMAMISRYNQAIMYDHIVPFRVLSPPQGNPAAQAAGALDTWSQGNMGTFMGQIQSLLRQHQGNPTGYNFFPMPLQFQQFGGDAKALIPVDLLEHTQQSLLKSMGIPSEFWSGSLKEGVSPIGLRLFERRWASFRNQLNKCATWLAQQYGTLNSPDIRAEFVELTINEDPTRAQAIAQLAGANRISQDTYFQQLGLSAKYENDKLQEEESEFGKQQEELQTIQARRKAKLDAMQAAVQAKDQETLQAMQPAQPEQGGAPAGGAPAGGPPPAGGSSGSPAPDSASISKMMDDAQQQAQEIWTDQDPLSRRRRLTDLKHQNESLYNQVMGELDKIKNNAQLQGAAASRAGQI